MTSPLIIAFVNTKGGVSKSTLASHLVLWLWDQGVRVALLDADGKQKTSGQWIQNAAPEIPVAIIQNSDSVADDIQAKLSELARIADVIVCDTAGHSDAASHCITLLCDIAVVPLQPSTPDVRAIRDALQFISLGQQISSGAKAKPRVLLTKTESRDVQARHLKRMISEDLNVPVLHAQMRHLIAFRDAADTAVHRMKGPHAKNAARDIDAIFQELLEDFLPELVGMNLKPAANE